MQVGPETTFLNILSIHQNYTKIIEKNDNFALFEEVVDNFGRSDDDMIHSLFSIDAYHVVSCTTITNIIERFLA